MESEELSFFNVFLSYIVRGRTCIAFTSDPEVVLLELWVRGEEGNQGCEVVDRLSGVVMDALCGSLAVRETDSCGGLKEKIVRLVVP